ncbi:MAG: bifunctional phosphoribosylaminoimidazolecarboxamide formyltransferase/IMP cyclohydrolase [Chloroflexota bacterium]|nr:bifunctional phosphoribosylaminoimidazolecarboxamide formyltransferase/IMP cyclohydrolase [Chloroflexota bacterium]
MIAIISVWDKTGVVEFARGLAGLGFQVYSTGGTHKALAEGGVAVSSVSKLTGFPEILDGRVKTLHPAVHGGILARRDRPAHLEELAKSGIEAIDLVAVNLYPFVETVLKEDVTLDDALENIDIGGPTMIRAAAKNYPHVLVVVEPADYSQVLDLLRAGEVPLDVRRRLALKAFQHVASYDTAIAQYLRGEEDAFPDQFTIPLVKLFDLRYGENPHQRAAVYREDSVLWGGKTWGIVAAEQLHGKALSYNNFLDAEAAWRAALDFAAPTAVVVKHTNPCGLACHEDLAEAYRRALSGDPVSAYGGIVAVNRELTGEAAQEMAKTFYEIVVAPAFSEEALAILQKKRDLRILRLDPRAAIGCATALEYRRVSGGFLAQEPDVYLDDGIELKVVTKREPTEEEVADLRFAWKVVKRVKSNAIVIARERTLLGMGAGQPNRVTSVHLALRRAEERARGAVLASDAFFPFPDGVELAAEGGVTAVIQPGGSIRDEEVIKAADERGMAMVFTGVRHFKH